MIEKGRLANASNSFLTSDNHIVLTKSAVDDEQISFLISTVYNSYVLISGIEYELAGLCLSQKIVMQ